MGWPESYLSERTFLDILARTTQLRERLAAGPQWAAFEEARQSVSQGLAAEFLPPVLDGHLHAGDLPSAFRRAFWMKWLSQAVEAKPPLARFNSLTHEERTAFVLVDIKADSQPPRDALFAKSWTPGGRIDRS